MRHTFRRPLCAHCLHVSSKLTITLALNLTLGAHLGKASAKVDRWKAQCFEENLDFGFAITGDGYKSKTKRKYNNHILVGASCPLYLGLVDCTGESGTGDKVFEEFRDVLETLPPPIRDAVFIGLLDTPSPNRKAWKLLMEKYPRQVWAGSMAHEVSLLANDFMKLTVSARLIKLCSALYKWVMNHSPLLALFKAKVRAYFEELTAKATSGHERAGVCMQQFIGRPKLRMLVYLFIVAT